MCFAMSAQIATFCKSLSTIFAFVGFFAGMTTHMNFQSA